MYYTVVLPYRICSSAGSRDYLPAQASLELGRSPPTRLTSHVRGCNQSEPEGLAGGLGSDLRALGLQRAAGAPACRRAVFLDQGAAHVTQLPHRRAVAAGVATGAAAGAGVVAAGAATDPPVSLFGLLSSASASAPHLQFCGLQYSPVPWLQVLVHHSSVMPSEMLTQASLTSGKGEGSATTFNACWASCSWPEGSTHELVQPHCFISSGRHGRPRPTETPATSRLGSASTAAMCVSCLTNLEAGDGERRCSHYQGAQASPTETTPRSEIDKGRRSTRARPRVQSASDRRPLFWSASTLSL